MVTKYSVVRYLPHPLSGEAMNIGIIAWAEGQFATKFIDNWQRVQTFGREDIGFLRNFVQQVESSTSTQKKLFTLAPESLDVPKLEKIVENWNHSIQFSEPRVSLKPLEEILSEVAPIYLLKSRERRHRVRDHRTAAMLALQSVSTVLTHSRGQQAADDLIKKQRAIRGKIDTHVFDVVVENGRPFFAAQGLSFEKSLSVDVQKDVDATAWAINDIRNTPAHRLLPVAILALPPGSDSQPFVRAKKVFRSLKAEMISEAEMGNWVKKTIRTSLPSTAGGSERLT
jgi:hypothetical protein